MTATDPTFILFPEVLEKIHQQLPDNLKDKWTDQELNSAAYFLTISGMIPAGTLQFADVNPLTVGLTTNFIAGALLVPYLAYDVIDPVRIHRFFEGLKNKTIDHEEFANFGQGVGAE
jgi:hypothetical protein